MKSADGGPAKTIVFANSKREACAGFGIESAVQHRYWAYSLEAWCLRGLLEVRAFGLKGAGRRLSADVNLGRQMTAVW